MGKVPVRLKEVVYTLSPNHLNVMSGLWKDIPGKLSEKFQSSWQNALFLITPGVAIYWLWVNKLSNARTIAIVQNFNEAKVIWDEYVEDFKEKEKQAHRY